jgi:hypothetical protein
MKISDIAGDVLHDKDELPYPDDTDEAHEDALARYREARDADPFFKRNTLLFAILGIVFLMYFIGSILHSIYK